MTVTITAWNDTDPGQPGFGNTSGFRSPLLGRLALLGALALHALDDHFAVNPQVPSDPQVPSAPPPPPPEEPHGFSPGEVGQIYTLLDGAGVFAYASERGAFLTNFLSAVQNQSPPASAEEVASLLRAAFIGYSGVDAAGEPLISAPFSVAEALFAAFVAAQGQGQPNA